MKGLLTKDWMLLKNNKSFFLIIFLLGGIFAFSWDNPYFPLSYVSILFAMFTISTIQYDMYEDGMTFLFSLPVSRKIYVLEKYVYGILLSVASICATSVLVWASAWMMRKELTAEEWLSSASAGLILILFFLTVMIPLKMKFEGEKHRIATFIFMGAIFALAYAAAEALKYSGIDAQMILDKLSSLSLTGIFAVVFALEAVMLVVSVVISMRILEKKEF